jgi:hypothetical protein
MLYISSYSYIYDAKQRFQQYNQELSLGEIMDAKAKMEEINYKWLFNLGFKDYRDNGSRTEFEKGFYSLSLYEDILYNHADDKNLEIYRTFDLYIVDYESDNSIHWPFKIKYKHQLLKIFDAMEIKLNVQ